MLGSRLTAFVSLALIASATAAYADSAADKAAIIKRLQSWPADFNAMTRVVS